MMFSTIYRLNGEVFGREDESFGFGANRETAASRAA